MNPILPFLLLLCFLPSIKSEEMKSETKTNYLLVLDAVEDKGVLTCTIKVPKLPPNISEQPNVHFEHLKKAWIEGIGFSVPLACPTPSQGGNIVFSLPAASLEGLTLQLAINVDGSHDYINSFKLLGYAKRRAEAIREFEDHMRKLEQAGADEPATAPKLESSGDENPNPQSKPRPR